MARVPPTPKEIYQYNSTVDGEKQASIWSQGQSSRLLVPLTGLCCPVRSQPTLMRIFFLRAQGDVFP